MPRFRLYFNNLFGEVLQSHTPSSHPGYELERSREFFGRMGTHALKILEMVKNMAFPSQTIRYQLLKLATFEMLWWRHSMTCSVKTYHWTSCQPGDFNSATTEFYWLRRQTVSWCIGDVEDSNLLKDSTWGRRDRGSLTQYFYR